MSAIDNLAEMTQVLPSLDVDIAKIAADARARLSAFISPENISLCNALIDMVRDDILQQLATEQPSTFTCINSEGRTYLETGIFALSTPSYFQKSLSDSLTVNDLFRSKDIYLKAEVRRGLASLAHELSQSFGANGGNFYVHIRDDEFVTDVLCVLLSAPLRAGFTLQSFNR